MPIPFSIIGFGYIGKRHAEMISNRPDCKLVAVCDTNPAMREAAETIYKVPFFDSPEKMLAAGLDSQVVSVCSPNGLHAEHAVMALKNKNHVVIEKPMGLTKSACEDVLYTSLQMSRQVFCVMQNRYSPPSVWLKSVISKNLLGKIVMVQVNCYWNRDDRYYKKGGWKGKLDMDGGPLFTQFSHFVDIMYWLFGDITDIAAKFECFNHKHSTEFEDSGFVNFKFVHGGLGAFNYSTSVWDKNLESRMTIIGEKGTIKVGGQYMENVEYCHIDNYTMPELPPSNPPNDYGTHKGSASNHHYIFENVVDTLQGKSTITTNAMEGMKIVEIIERIYGLRKL